MSRILPLLAGGTGIGPSRLMQIINNAPKSYKIFEIPKKRGGTREIAQPSSELKIVQRALVDSYLYDLPCHQAATAYRKGISLRENAAVHAGHTPIAKFDFKDFFPSITAADWERYCLDRGELDAFDIEVTKKLLFMRRPSGRILRLSIGAPSSPILSNILMYEFDKTVTELLKSDKVIYTRYADDMTFSAPRMGHLKSVEKKIKKALKLIMFPKLKINISKTTFVTTKYSRRVTGLVLTNDGHVTIGRERKRWVRSAINYYKLNKISDRDRERLTGLIAFIKSVDVEYFYNLKLHYGDELIDGLMRIPARRRYARKTVFFGDEC